MACKKKHAKQTKKVGLGQTPPPSMGKIPTFYRFFSGGPPLPDSQESPDSPESQYSPDSPESPKSPESPDQAWKFCIFWERRSEPKKIQEPKKTKKKEMKRGERERKEKRGERE